MSPLRFHPMGHYWCEEHTQWYSHRGREGETGMEKGYHGHIPGESDVDRTKRHMLEHQDVCDRFRQQLREAEHQYREATRLYNKALAAESNEAREARWIRDRREK